MENQESWETQRDIVRPGDPNFVSFPRIPFEDCVEYHIYVVPAPGDGVTNPPSSTQTSKIVEERLRDVQSTASKLAKTQLKEYIWQRESFGLALVKPSAESSSLADSTLHLHGRTCYGDCAADEWTVVWILRELSRQHQDIWIRVYDADGEFLLAEAAEKLPQWIEPDTARHRVWICGGELKILGPTVSWRSENIGGADHSNNDESTKKSGRRTRRTMKARGMQPLSLSSALQLITSISPDSVALPYPEVEALAFRRINEYPGAIKTLFHSTRIAIPRRLAYILLSMPNSTSSAVEALVLQDPATVRKARPITNQSPKFPPTDLVTMRIKFNRISFAQLKAQQVETTPSWSRVISGARLNSSEAVLERLVLGMKLCEGFQLLMASHTDYTKSIRRGIEMLLDQLENGEDDLPSNEQIKSSPDQDVADDDESWLNVDYNEFEHELSSGSKGGQRYGEGATGAFKDKAAEDTLRRMMKGFEGLMQDEDSDNDDDTDDSTDENDDDDDDDYDTDENNTNANIAKMKRLALHQENRVEDNHAMTEKVEENSRNTYRPMPSGSDVDKPGLGLDPTTNTTLHIFPEQNKSTKVMNRSDLSQNRTTSPKSTERSTKRPKIQPLKSDERTTNVDDGYDSDASDASDIALIMSTIAEEMQQSGGTLDLSHLGISSIGHNGSGEVDDLNARRALAQRLLQSFRGVNESDGNEG